MSKKHEIQTRRNEKPLDESKGYRDWSLIDWKMRSSRNASQDGLECRISLPQDPGQAGKAQASYLVQKLAGYNVTTSTESGDKVTRASPMAAQAEAGNIDILEGEWNDTFLNELSVFPAGSKDQTDAASRAFNELVMASRFNLTNML